MRRLMVISMVVVATALTTACHAGGSTGVSTQTIEVTMWPKQQAPSGSTVHVTAGQQVQLLIKAQSGGALTLHTSPARTIHYDMGTTLVPIGSFEAQAMIAVTSTTAISSVTRIEVDGAA